MEFRLRLLKADLAARLDERLQQLPEGLREAVAGLRAKQHTAH